MRQMKVLRMPILLNVNMVIILFDISQLFISYSLDNPSQFPLRSNHACLTSNINYWFNYPDCVYKLIIYVHLFLQVWFKFFYDYYLGRFAVKALEFLKSIKINACAYKFVKNWASVESNH